MKVFTYFDQVDSLNDPDLLALWKASWERHGWEAVVLTQKDAIAADPKMVERVRNSPLLKSHPLNPVGYVMACIMRYVPMTVIQEPALHVDWDVLGNGFKPSDVVGPLFPVSFLAGCRCPCAMYGSPAAWRMLAAIMEGAAEMANFDPAILATDNADQYVTMYEIPADWAIIDPRKPCLTYNEDANWQTGGMIHFPNRLTGYPRSKKIRELGFTT